MRHPQDLAYRIRRVGHDPAWLVAVDEADGTPSWTRDPDSDRVLIYQSIILCELDFRRLWCEGVECVIEPVETGSSFLPFPQPPSESTAA